MKSKLCISPIISTILILVVTILSVTSFLSWYSSYESNLNTKIESTVKQGNSIIIETIAGSVLYVKSNENTTIKSIKLDNNICSLDLNLTIGINEIDISTCLNNLTRSNPSVSLVSDNQVLSKNIYIKTAIINTTSSQVPFSYNNCIFSGINISHNDNMTFYLQEFSGLGCVNEIRTCNNGVLSGSYNYTNCSTELALGGDYIEDFEIDGTNYRAHIFTQAGEHSFIVQTNNLDVDYLVVAGGGGGMGYNTYQCGGGGAGGLLKHVEGEDGNTEEDKLSLVYGTYPVSVGLGGRGSYHYVVMGNPLYVGENGYNSSLSSLTAVGGGGGSETGYIGGLGGSGGGSVRAGGSSGTTVGGSGIFPQGHSGGTVQAGAGSGGGGASMTGLPAPVNGNSKGGDGKISNIIPVSLALSLNIGHVIENDVWFAGGGAGTSYTHVTHGIQAKGGGGFNDNRNALPSTGSGGAGGWCKGTSGSDINPVAGDGSTGVVIIRYEID